MMFSGPNLPLRMEWRWWCFTGLHQCDSSAARDLAKATFSLMVQAPYNQHTGAADLVPQRIRELICEYAPRLTNHLCLQFGILADRLDRFVNTGHEAVAEVFALALIPFKGLRNIALG
jgi:hypothetical protein